MVKGKLHNELVRHNFVNQRVIVRVDSELSIVAHIGKRLGASKSCQGRTILDAVNESTPNVCEWCIYGDIIWLVKHLVSLRDDVSLGLKGRS